MMIPRNIYPHTIYNLIASDNIYKFKGVTQQPQPFILTEFKSISQHKKKTLN